MGYVEIKMMDINGRVVEKRLCELGAQNLGKGKSDQGRPCTNYILNDLQIEIGNYISDYIEIKGDKADAIKAARQIGLDMAAIDDIWGS